MGCSNLVQLILQSQDMLLIVMYPSYNYPYLRLFPSSIPRSPANRRPHGVLCPPVRRPSSSLPSTSGLCHSIRILPSLSRPRLPRGLWHNFPNSLLLRLLSQSGYPLLPPSLKPLLLCKYVKDSTYIHPLLHLTSYFKWWSNMLRLPQRSELVPLHALASFDLFLHCVIQRYSFDNPPLFIFHAVIVLLCPTTPFLFVACLVYSFLGYFIRMGHYFNICPETTSMNFHKSAGDSYSHI